MFYDTFQQLCEKNGITPTAFARKSGMPQSAVAMWKKRGSIPKYETLQKIAAYFGVSVDSLVDSEAKKEPPAVSSEGEKKELDARLNALLEGADDDLKRAMLVFLERSQNK